MRNGPVCFEFGADYIPACPAVVHMHGRPEEGGVGEDGEGDGGPEEIDVGGADEGDGGDALKIGSISYLQARVASRIWKLLLVLRNHMYRPASVSPKPLVPLGNLTPPSDNIPTYVHKPLPSTRYPQQSPSAKM